MARKFISYNGRIVSDNLTLKLLGQDVSSGPQCGDTPFTNTKSIEFDGTNDYIDVGDNDSLSFGDSVTDSPFSISAWIKMDTTTSFSICSKYASSNTLEYQFIFVSGGRLIFRLFDGGSTVRIGRLTADISSNVGSWTHVVATYDGSSTLAGIKIYVNNSRADVTDSSLNTYVAMHNTSAPFEIGRYSTSYADGLIDEVAIFNTELSSTDVTAIYNSGIPNDLCTLNPLSWWRMGDGDTFPTLTDNGSGGNDGTMTNMSSGNIVEDVPDLFSNKSFEFDGTDDTINVGATPSCLRFNRLDTFSFSAWVKVDTTQNNVILANQLAPSTNYRGYYFAVNSSNQVIVILRSTLSDRLIYTSTTTITNGLWYHIVFTYDGTATTTGGNIYINNSLDTLTRTGTLTGTMESTDPLYLGSRDDSDNWISGSLDEISIFNTELSASDVVSIYNNGVPNDISSLNPISWFRMGEDATWDGTQWTLSDNGSCGNDGTSENMSLASRTNDVPPSDWAPTNVNTVAWIDASDTGSYTTAGSTLTSVTDKAGTYTMNIGNTPTVVTGGLNSLNVFDFDGNGEYLQSSTYSNQTSSGNHWAVGVFLADFVDGDKDSFWSYETNQSPKRDYAVSSAGGGSNSWPGELDLDALSSNRISSTIGNKQDWNLQSVSIDSWVIVSGWFNKTGNQIGNRVNGNNAYTPVNDYDNSISPNQELRLMRNRASQELDGRLAEFFAVADLPGTGGTDLTDLEKAEGYLAWKWGLEGNLPVSHPYKNSPPTV